MFLDLCCIILIEAFVCLLNCFIVPRVLVVFNGFNVILRIVRLLFAASNTNTCVV